MIMMNNEKYRTYRTKVGIDLDSETDDETVMINLPISDEAAQLLVQKGKSLIGVDNHLEDWDYIEVFTPHVYSMAVSLVGIKLKGNPNYYKSGHLVEVFLPHKLSDKIWNTSKGKSFEKVHRNYEEISHQRWEQDLSDLRENLAQNRWKPLDINPKCIRNSWSGGYYNSNYSISLGIDSKGMLVYGKIYTYLTKNIQMEIECYNISSEVIRNFGDKLNKDTSSEIKVEETPNYKYIRLSTMTDDNDFGIKLLMQLLDEIAISGV